MPARSVDSSLASARARCVSTTRKPFGIERRIRDAGGCTLHGTAQPLAVELGKLFENRADEDLDRPDSRGVTAHDASVTENPGNVGPMKTLNVLPSRSARCSSACGKGDNKGRGPRVRVAKTPAGLGWIERAGAGAAAERGLLANDHAGIGRPAEADDESEDRRGDVPRHGRHDQAR